MEGGGRVGGTRQFPSGGEKSGGSHAHPQNATNYGGGNTPNSERRRPYASASAAPGVSSSGFGRNSPRDFFERHHQRSESPDPLRAHMRGDPFDRDAFFDHPGRGWGGLDPPSGFFGRRPFDGFPSHGGFPGPHFDISGGFPNDPHEEFGFRHHPQQGFRHPQQQHPQHPQQQYQPPQQQPQQQHKQSQPAPENMNHHKGSRAESIPIRVVHERSDHHAGSPGSKKYGTRNTTELPAARSPAEGSPRIARAHSEPPKAFQKTFAQMRHPDQVPIPEGDVPENLAVPGTHPGSGSNLENPAHNLATSASAPSVPSSQRAPATEHHRASPVPPPRRGSPTKSHTPPYHDDIRKQSAPPGVRHIPIFVEGREEPVVNRERQRPTSFQQNHGNFEGGFNKPSDFYPSGTRKATRGDEKPFSNLRTQQQQPGKGQQHPTEPTSPISPPPGPIPMGFVPKEPTSPLPAPDGPIPLPCSPNFYNNVNNNNNAESTEQIKKEEEERQRKPTMVPPPPPQRKASAEKPVEEKERKDSFSVPIKVVQQPEKDSVDSTQPPQQPPPAAEEPPKPKEEPQKKSNDPSLEKLEKIQNTIAELVAKIEAFKGSKKDKEYLYLDEMLTRQLLALDCIETGGRDELRKMRKESIKSVNRCLSMLDSKAKAANASKEAKENNDILDALAAKSKAEAAAK